MSKSKLVRDGRHMRPMLAVLARYDIGAVDQFGRGRWIVRANLRSIYKAMMADDTLLPSSCDSNPVVMGTNMHNWVEYRDFERLFEDDEVISK